MTPGTYIRLRREAAGLSIEQAEAAIAAGMLSAPLAELEADTAMPRGMDGAVLSYAFAIDDMVLAALCADQGGGDQVRICRECGCSRNDPCEPRTGLFCAWAEADLCTACTPVEKALSAYHREIEAVARSGEGPAPIPATG